MVNESRAVIECLVAFSGTIIEIPLFTNPAGLRACSDPGCYRSTALATVDGEPWHEYCLRLAQQQRRR